MTTLHPVIAHVATASSALLEDICSATGAPLWMANLLAQRGCHSGSEALSFLEGPAEAIGDPWSMKGMEDAVDFLLRFRDPSRELCIFGDYDLDGISATALLLLALRRAGGWNLRWKLPSRFEEGYGPGKHFLDEIGAAGVQGLIMVDTGITLVREVEYAKTLGLEVAIVDHHQPADDGLPPAEAILDPWQAGCGYPNKDLSAVGVVLKLVTALFERIDVGGADDFLDLVALGTLSDMMPMGRENRQMLRKALARMHASVFPGVKVLCEEVADAEGFLGSQDVLFRIAPLMNAPGRLERPDIALEMLLSNSEKDARKTLEQLRKANERRREIEAEITREALLQAESRIKDSRLVVVSAKGWHLGVLGIVASKLVQMFGRPAAVLSIGDDGLARASVRGVEGAGFNWHQALADSRDRFERWGGHMNAAGFCLQADRIDEIRQRFEESAARQGYAPGVSQAILECHAEVRLCEMNHQAMEWLRKLEPFGRTNPMPVLVARGVRLSAGAREVRGGHVQFEVVQDEGVKLGAVGFGMGDSAAWLRDHSKGVDIAFMPMWNAYRGRRFLQLQVKALGTVEG